MQWHFLKSALHYDGKSKLNHLTGCLSKQQNRKTFFFLELLDWTTRLQKNSQGRTNHFSLEEVLSVLILRFFIKNILLVIFAKLGSYFIFSYIFIYFTGFFGNIVYLGSYIFSKLFYSSGQKKYIINFNDFLCFIIFLVKNGVFQGFQDFFKFFPKKNPIMFYIRRSIILSWFWIFHLHFIFV